VTAVRDGRDLARTGLTPYPSDMTEHLDPALVDTWFAAWSRSRGYRISREAGRRAALRTPRPARMIPGGSGRATVDVPATWEHVVVNPSRAELEDLREALRDQEQILLTVFGDAGEDPKAMGLKAQAEPEYLDLITDEPDGDGDGAMGDEGGGTGDDLYDRAVAVVTRDRKASTSYVQRRLQIGYNRAATLIERMEQEGVVSPANHAGKREVLAGPPPMV